MAENKYTSGYSGSQIDEALDVVRDPKNKNKVFAGPSTGSDATPSFRSLVADDIPSITKSKISDFPTTMPPSSHTHTVSQISDFPESMPASDVSAWAKASSKPTYTASEVGAATSDHTHTTSLATSTGTSTITLAAGAKYQLTAGGTSVVFTMPSNPDYSDTYAAKSHTHTKSQITDFPESMPASDVYDWAKASTKPSYTASEVGAIATSAKGANSGVAELDANGKVPSSQLPSFVDDVLEYDSQSSFPTTGESGKIYIATDTNKTYRWSGTTYVSIASDLALGETSSTAYRGDRGKIAYDHSQATHARTDATAVSSSTTNGNIKIDGTETTVYTHPTTTAVTAAAVKVGKDSAGHVVIGSALTASDVGAATSGHTHTAADVGAATSDHTHTTSLATDTGTSSITLASAGKYKLTAGGTSVIFTMPTIPTVNYPVTSVAGKTGAVTLEASDVGLGNVGNFKAVSTVASQGLTDTEKSNARTNIGAGTSSLTIGTTASTAAAGNHTHSDYVPTTRTINSKALSGDISLTASDVGASASDHTHTLSMATSTGTSSIDLAADTKYQLTAGGSTYIFKTPAAGSTTDSYHTTGSWNGLTYTATAVGNAGALAFTIPTGTTSTTVAAGNHTHTFASLTNKPTTLSGYGITDGTAASHTHPYEDNYKFVLSTSDALYTAINNAGWTSDVIV